LLIDFIAHALHIAPDLRQRRPVGRLVARQSAVDRVDPKGEKMIEVGVKTRRIKKSSPKQVPIESLEMTDVEDDPVPLADRAVI